MLKCDVTLFPDNSFSAVITGPQGCGKTTLMETLPGVLKRNGAADVLSGELDSISGCEVRGKLGDLEKHRLGFVIQRAVESVIRLVESRRK